MSVNPKIAPPAPPHDQVDAKRCCCGAEFDAHRAGVGFADGCALIRAVAAQDGDEGGGWRSRGAVLWAMHVLKLQDWYLSHAYCDELAELVDRAKAA